MIEPAPGAEQQPDSVAADLKGSTLPARPELAPEKGQLIDFLIDVRSGEALSARIAEELTVRAARDPLVWSHLSATFQDRTADADSRRFCADILTAVGKTNPALQAYCRAALTQMNPEQVGNWDYIDVRSEVLKITMLDRDPAAAGAVARCFESRVSQRGIVDEFEAECAAALAPAAAQDNVFNALLTFLTKPIAIERSWSEVKSSIEESLSAALSGEERAVPAALLNLELKKLPTNVSLQRWQREALIGLGCRAWDASPALLDTLCRGFDHAATQRATLLQLPTAAYADVNIGERVLNALKNSSDIDVLQRREIIQRLGTAAGSNPAVEQQLQEWAAGDELCGSCAARALAKAAAEDSSLMTRLEQALSTWSTETQAAVVSTFAEELRHGKAELLDKVLSYLDSPQANLRETAFKGLLWDTAKAHKRARSALLDSLPTLLTNDSTTLNQIGSSLQACLELDPEVEDALLKILKTDSDWQARYVAVVALKIRVVQPEVLAQIMSCCGSTENEMLRSEAISALAPLTAYIDAVRQVMLSTAAEGAFYSAQSAAEGLREAFNQGSDWVGELLKELDG